MKTKMAYMNTEVTAVIKIGGNQGFSHSNTDDKPTRHSRQDSSRRFTCLTFFSWTIIKDLSTNISILNE